MLGILFLLLAVWVGFVLVKRYLPDFLATEGLPPILTALPAAFTVGVIASGLLTYVICLIFAHTGQGMAYGSAVAGAIMVAYAALTMKKTIPDRRVLKADALRESIMKSVRNHPALYCFLLLLAGFLGWLFTHCFFYQEGSLYVGYSVFSDFGPHVAVIRSFSVGNNFPAQYPHFPDGSMLYHFMFQFYTGILEHLGLRIDNALNTLSLISLMSAMSLLYALSVKITKKPAVGVVAIVLFLFRSSFSAFTFLFDGTQYDSIAAFFGRILDNRVFIGNTPNENWGLWNLNVYANQRHLGFGLSLILMLILAFLPLFKGGCLDFFKSESWRTQNIKRYIFLGLLAGGAAYFHGSCVVAALGILAVMAIFSKEKLGFAIFAGIAVALTVLQNNYFSAGAPGIAPSFQFGFIAPDKTLMGVAKYLFELTGVIFPVVLAGAILKWKGSGGLFFAFLIPAALTFTLSLTPDITVNHKFLMISIALLNIFAAYAIVSVADAFAKGKSKVLRGVGIALAGALALVLTISGILDVVPYNRQSGDGSRAVYLDTASETVAWIEGNTEPGSVFLSNWHVQSPILMAGRFEYMGWPYFGWSAGYDTDARSNDLKAVFSTWDGEELRTLALGSGASYIYVDWDLIENQEFGFNEETTASVFPLVFSSDAENVRIYRIE